MEPPDRMTQRPRGLDNGTGPVRRRASPGQAERRWGCPPSRGRPPRPGRLAPPPREPRRASGLCSPKWRVLELRHAVLASCWAPSGQAVGASWSVQVRSELSRFGRRDSSAAETCPTGWIRLGHWGPALPSVFGHLAFSDVLATVDWA